MHLIGSLLNYKTKIDIYALNACMPSVLKQWRGKGSTQSVIILAFYENRSSLDIINLHHRKY